MKNPEKTGVEDLLRKSSLLRGLKTSHRFKGMLPLGCLPHWGREGVTLLTAAEYKIMIRKIGFQQSRVFQSVDKTGELFGFVLNLV